MSSPASFMEVFKRGLQNLYDRKEKEREIEERNLRLQNLKNQMARLKEEQALEDFKARYAIRQGQPGPSVPGVPGTGGGMEELLNARPEMPKVFRAPIAGLEKQNFPHLPVPIPEHLGGGTATPQTQQQIREQTLQDLLAKRRIEQMTPPAGESLEPIGEAGSIDVITGERIAPFEKPAEITPYQQESLALQRQRLERGAQPIAGRDFPLPADVEAQRLRMGAAARASPREVATARDKLSKIGLARIQLANIKDKFNKAKGSIGIGQGALPTASGQAFDAAVDAIRQTFIALTRTPGVGAMSDFETRLSQAPLPERKAFRHESVTKQQIEQLEAMLNALEQGYAEIATGAGQEGPQPGTVEDGYRFNGGDPADPNNWEKVE